MCAKAAKIKQTDYTKGGRDISNTAIPLYQQNVQRLGDYMDNVQNRLDPYLKYSDMANAASQSDFLRKYNRDMANLTGQNYSATTGGYSSQNQLGYDDQQRYYNDLASRMQQYGIGTAADLASQEYNMIRGANADYQSAYQLGEPYSYYDQYNDLVDQQNKSWVSNLLTSAGDSIGSMSMSSGNPWVMAIGGTIGGAMGTAGRMTGSDTSGAMAALRGGGTRGGATGGQYSSGGLGSGETDYASRGLTNLFSQQDWFKNNPFSKGSTAGVSGNSMSNFSGTSGGSGLGSFNIGSFKGFGK